MSDIQIISPAERKTRQHLGELICAVRSFSWGIDRLYSPDSTVTGIERGKAVARMVNALCLVNDQALYYGLGLDFRKDPGMNFATIKKLSRKMFR